jgi:hypothetical protein
MNEEQSRNTHHVGLDRLSILFFLVGGHVFSLRMKSDWKSCFSRSARYSSPRGDVLKFAKEKNAFALRSCRWFHNPDRVGIAFEFFHEEMIFRLDDDDEGDVECSEKERLTGRT